MKSKANWFFEKDVKWKQEYIALRKIILKNDLIEELKWENLVILLITKM